MLAPRIALRTHLLKHRLQFELFLRRAKRRVTSRITRPPTETAYFPSGIEIWTFCRALPNALIASCGSAFIIAQAMSINAFWLDGYLEPLELLVDGVSHSFEFGDFKFNYRT
jgi:hypothetical protein